MKKRVAYTSSRTSTFKPKQSPYEQPLPSSLKRPPRHGNKVSPAPQTQKLTSVAAWQKVPDSASSPNTERILVKEFSHDPATHTVVETTTGETLPVESSTDKPTAASNGTARQFDTSPQPDPGPAIPDGNIAAENTPAIAVHSPQAATADVTYGKWAPTHNPNGSITWKMNLQTFALNPGQAAPPGHVMHYLSSSDTDAQAPHFGDDGVEISFTVPKDYTSSVKILPPRDISSPIAPSSVGAFIEGILRGKFQDQASFEEVSLSNREDPSYITISEGGGIEFVSKVSYESMRDRTLPAGVPKSYSRNPVLYVLEIDGYRRSPISESCTDADQLLPHSIEVSSTLVLSRNSPTDVGTMITAATLANIELHPEEQIDLTLVPQQLIATELVSRADIVLPIDALRRIRHIANDIVIPHKNNLIQFADSLATSEYYSKKATKLINPYQKHYGLAPVQEDSESVADKVAILKTELAALPDPETTDSHQAARIIYLKLCTLYNACDFKKDTVHLKNKKIIKIVAITAAVTGLVAAVGVLTALSFGVVPLVAFVGFGIASTMGLVGGITFSANDSAIRVAKDKFTQKWGRPAQEAQV